METVEKIAMMTTEIEEIRLLLKSRIKCVLPRSD